MHSSFRHVQSNIFLFLIKKIRNKSRSRSCHSPTHQRQWIPTKLWTKLPRAHRYGLALCWLRNFPPALLSTGDFHFRNTAFLKSLMRSFFPTDFLYLTLPSACNTLFSPHMVWFDSLTSSKSTIRCHLPREPSLMIVCKTALLLRVWAGGKSWMKS